MKNTLLSTPDHLQSWFRRVSVTLTHVRIPMSAVWTVVELGLITLWAVYAGRAYLNFDLNLWPSGTEFPLSIRGNFFWRNFLKCAECAFWNGSINGGFPALADLQSAFLHPLVAVPTLLYGVINGAKVSLILGLALAGLAQWWLGRLLGLGRFARTWAALMAVVAGTLTGRMEDGLITLILSTASAALVIPAGINLAFHPGRRSAVLLAGALTLSILAGQAYLQLGLAWAILPALLILFIRPRPQSRLIWRSAALSGGLALLLSAAFLLPLLHFYPNFVKDTDPEFRNVQPIEYQPINLVVRGDEFFRNEVLDKSPYPYLFFNYIGWVPLILAGLALRLIPREKNRLLAFFLAAIGLVYLSSSMILPKALIGMFNMEFLYSIRHPTLMVGLVGPLILGLAAWGLDLALRGPGPEVSLRWGGGEITAVRLSWILLAVPLFLALGSVYQQSQIWLGMSEQPKESQAVIKLMATPSSQWVMLPNGEHYWAVYAVENQIKLTQTFSPWSWKGKDLPLPNVEGTREPGKENEPTVWQTLQGVAFFQYPQNQYASVSLPGGESVPCMATSYGGYIDVDCQTSAAGVLKVMENSWNGWQGWVDYQAQRLLPGKWLSLNAPAGSHHYTFRYVPWDVPLGLLFSLIGLGLCVGLWRKPEEPPAVMVK